MNKKLYVLILATVLTASYAQAQFSYGVRAGLNISTVVEEDNIDRSVYYYYDVETKFKKGFHIGAVGEYEINKSFAVQPAILFTTLGWKRDINASFFSGFSEGYEENQTIYFNYFQIPVNALYKSGRGKTKFLLQAGPYLGYALNGKIKKKIDVGFFADDEEEKLEFGSNDDEWNRIDYGFGLGVGLQFNNIQASIGCNVGLKDFDNHKLVSRSNWALTFSLAYFLQ